MLVVYASRTGNVKRFINNFKDKVECKNINEISEQTQKPFILVTYTTGFGDVPSEVEEFLEKNHRNLIGVCASGNRNWKEHYAESANKISEKYNVPILMKFEIGGTTRDIARFLEILKSKE